MAGLFDTFSIAKRGLQVNQSLINTTSHNIANAETEGYSRQRSVVETTTPSGGNSKFDTCTVGQVGTGSQITAIQRIRDTFMDARVRNQKSENGSLDVQDGYLGQVEDTVNETADTGVQKALSDFYTSFSSLSQGAATSSNKTVAIGKASTLVTKISDRYNDLETQKTDVQSQLKADVTSVNDTLDDINTLNDQIKKVSSLGMSPNDLMDKRDNLLDTLSTKLGITVTSGKDNTVGVTANEDTAAVGTLVNATDATASTTRLSYYDPNATTDTYDSATQTLKVTYDKLGDSSNPTTISITGVTSQADADSLKADLEKNRILITDNNGDLTAASASTISETDFKSAMYANTEKGEIGGHQTVQTQIQNSMDDLNTIAKSVAYTVNAIQTGSNTDGSVASDLNSSELVFVKDGTTSDDNISAANIKVNSVLVGDSTKLNSGSSTSAGEADGTRALAISNISSLKINYTNSGVASATTRNGFLSAAGITFDTSSINNSNLTGGATGTTITNYYISALSKLDTNAKKVSDNLTTAETSMNDLVNQRTSVSGVSTDEESTNLIEYNHAYQANAKVISTINNLLDVVINGLGV